MAAGCDGKAKAAKVGGGEGRHPGDIGEGVEMTTGRALGTSSADRSREGERPVEGNVGSAGRWAQARNARAKS